MTGSPSTSPDPLPIPAGRRAVGRLDALPASKSVVQRYLNLALLARRPLLLERTAELLASEDVRLFLAAVERLGWAAEESAAGMALTPGPPPPKAEIWCGAGGTMLRFLAATLAALPGEWRLDGSARLRERPIGPLVDALRPLGAKVEYLGAEGHPPLAISGGLEGGATLIDAGQSSQFLSALLMASAVAAAPVEVEVTALTSVPYLDLTLDAAARFGLSCERVTDSTFRVEPGLSPPARLRAEADYSAAAYPAAAAALTGGKVELEGLDRGSRQGDRRFLDLLVAMGAEVEWRGESLVVAGGRPLAGVDVDLADMPDQVPTLAALAPFAAGTTRIRNVPHLRLKESDRLAAMARELARLGASVEEHPDGLTVHGTWATALPPDGDVEVETYDDHRIAMSLALTGLRRPGVAIREPAVAGKSYPGFWRDLETLLSR